MRYIAQGGPTTSLCWECLIIPLQPVGQLLYEVVLVWWDFKATQIYIELGMGECINLVFGFKPGS